jgi:hypothetical protein
MVKPYAGSKRQELLLCKDENPAAETHVKVMAIFTAHHIAVFSGVKYSIVGHLRLDYRVKQRSVREVAALKRKDARNSVLPFC